MKVTAILKGRTDSNGHQPVQIRIFRNGKSTYKPTGIKVAPELFNKGRVKPVHPKARDYNQLIETRIIQCQASTLEGFKKKIPKTDFFAYVNKTIPLMGSKDSTVRYYNSQVEKIRAYNPSFYLDEVTPEFIAGYKAFLIERGNEGNTIWAAFKFLKTFIKQAVKNDLLEKNPFDKVPSLQYVEPHKNYLTEEEVKDIDKFIGAKCPAKIFEAGTWFLIACYTGLRISDIKAFTKKNIVADRLVIRTQKTKEMVGLPISPRLRKYFERVEYKPLSMHEYTYNKLIKVIAAACGINKNISSHTARHTAAMMLANAGVSQEVTAKILGHSSLKHTATYYKISNVRIDREMKKLK